MWSLLPLDELYELVLHMYQWCRKVKNIGGASAVVIDGDNQPSPVPVSLHMSYLVSMNAIRRRAWSFPFCKMIKSSAAFHGVVRNLTFEIKNGQKSKYVALEITMCLWTIFLHYEKGFFFSQKNRDF